MNTVCACIDHFSHPFSLFLFVPSSSRQQTPIGFPYKLVFNERVTGSPDSGSHAVTPAAFTEQREGGGGE